MMRRRAVLIIVATIVVMGAVRAHAQTVRATGPDRVSVKANQTPIGDLIDQLSVVSPLKFIALDPVDRGVAVSFEAEDVSSLDAIVLALKASGLDYAMSGTRLIAGRAKKALDNGGPVSWGAVGAGREVPPTAPAPRVQPPHVDEHDLVQPVVPARVFDAVPERESGNRVSPATSSDTPDNDSHAVSMSVKFSNADEFGRALGVKSVPFIVVEDSAKVTQPGFVPYKLRPEVKNRRLFANIADIP